MTLALTNSWLHLLPRYSLLVNEERKRKLLARGVKVTDFGVGDPLEPTPAFIREALLSHAPTVSQYPSTIGSPLFRQACAQWVQRRFGVAVSWEKELISSNGSKEAIFHIPQVLLNSGSGRRILAFPDPGYPVYKSSAVLSGAVPWAVPLRPEKNYIFDPDDIAPEMRRQIAALWVCYPHNPTGALIQKPQMQRIYNWALENDILLLSDECYVDMYFPGTDKPPSFLEIAKENEFKNLLCFFSLSKRSGMTGYRTGFVAGDARYVSLCTTYRPHAGLGTPDFVQSAAIAAWSDDSHVVQRNAIFAEKRAIVDEVFLKKGIRMLPSTATFYVWAQVPKGMGTGEDYAQKVADECGAVITPGDSLGDSCNDWFRLALVPSADEIRACLARWPG